MNYIVDSALYFSLALLVAIYSKQKDRWILCAAISVHGLWISSSILFPLHIYTDFLVRAQSWSNLVWAGLYYIWALRLTGIRINSSFNLLVLGIFIALTYCYIFTDLVTRGYLGETGTTVWADGPLIVPAALYCVFLCVLCLKSLWDKFMQSNTVDLFSLLCFCIIFYQATWLFIIGTIPGIAVYLNENPSMSNYGMIIIPLAVFSFSALRTDYKGIRTNFDRHGATLLTLLVLPLTITIVYQSGKLEIISLFYIFCLWGVAFDKVRAAFLTFLGWVFSKASNTVTEIATIQNENVAPNMKAELRRELNSISLKAQSLNSSNIDLQSSGILESVEKLKHCIDLETASVTTLEGEHKLKIQKESDEGKEPSYNTGTT